MNNNGIVILAIGLLATSLSSFIGQVAIFGTGTNFIRGFFDGIAVVAFGVAIFVLVRSSRVGQG
jgi:hypothetical protein